MKAAMITAASALCLISNAVADTGADRGAYELRLDQKNGDRTIAVSNVASGALAVAAGGKRLDLLTPENAAAALKRLKNGSDLDIRPDDDGDKRKIVIHKMGFDDGEETGENDNREIRILKRPQREDDDSKSDTDSDDLFSMELDSDDEAASGDEAIQERRILFIKGAGAKTAAKFIDKIDGLEADEKAAMKEAVGL